MFTLYTSCPSPRPSQPRPAERKLRSLYRRPVTGWARGNYIIAPLNGHRLDTSPETMITCIIKVRSLMLLDWPCLHLCERESGIS